MKRFLATVISVFMIIGMLPMNAFGVQDTSLIATEQTENAHWAAESADRLKNAGVLDGGAEHMLDNLDGEATRAQAVSALVRSMTDGKLPEVSDEDTSKFSDTAGHAAESEILAAVALGYVGGYPDGTFRPDNTITRAEIAKITAVALGLKASENASNPFTDLSENDWEYEYVLACAEKGLLKGYADGSFRADGKITCGESIAVTDRAYEATEHSAHTEIKAEAEPATTKAKPSSGSSTSSGSSGGSSGGANSGSSSNNSGSGSTGSPSDSSASSSGSSSGNVQSAVSDSTSGQTVRPLGAASSVWNGSIATSFAGGSGSEDDPYLIATGEQLAYLAKQVNAVTSYSGKYFKLTADITLNDTTNWQSWGTEDSAPANSWTAIGTSSNRFKGTFDGDGHVVRGIYINTESSYQGLFGYAENATIKNVGVVESYIRSSSRSSVYVGGVVGMNNGGTATVINCYNEGAVTGSSTSTGYSVVNVGGVVGYNYANVGTATVINCYNEGAVSGSGTGSSSDIYVGGVVGYNYAAGNGTATVSNCYNTGDVSGSGHVGGVVGRNSGQGGGQGGGIATVSNCYNTGAVTGTDTGTGGYAVIVGGVVGSNYAYNGTATVSNCYNTGGVTGTATGTGNSVYVGGVVGYNDAYSYNSSSTATVSNLSNCYNTGDVTGTGTGTGTDYSAVAVKVGGVVGSNYAYSYNSSSTATVSNLSNCYNMGAVSGTYAGTGYSDVYVGGVVGQNDANDGGTATVSNCYCLDTAYSGDLVGKNEGDNATVTDVAYKTTAQMKSAEFVSLLDRNNEMPCWKRSNVENNGFPILEWQKIICDHNWSEWTTEATPTCTQPGSRSRSCTICDEKVTEQVAALGHNVSDWTTIEPTCTQEGSRSGYCTICNEKVTEQIAALGHDYQSQVDKLICSRCGIEYNWDGSIAESFADGSGTEADPYQIATAEQLAFLAALTNQTVTYNGSKFDTTGKYFKLTAEIVLNDTSNWESWGTTAPANSWTAIGTSSNSFKGAFDGDGHVVRGIYINSTEADYQGLFGLTENATIKNVGVVESYIKGRERVGGVVGYNNYGTVSNCYNTGAVEGSSYHVGGVVGRNAGEGGTATVINCYNTGAVSSSSADVGGVVGSNYAYNGTATVSNCYNTGDVSGSGTVGGVVGYNRDSTVSNCYNTGAISSEDGTVGGVVGENEGYFYTATVINCYNTGTVTGTYTGSYNSKVHIGVGGVVGRNYENERAATVSDCYNTGAVTGTGHNVDVGGVVGYNDSWRVSNCYCFDTAYSGKLIGYGSTGTDVEYKTAAEMKSAEFVSLLDADNKTPCWKKSNSMNNGFPILQWQCEHNVSEWTIDVAVTCTYEGSKSGICTVCDKNVVEKIAALGHDYQLQDGKTVCSRCGIDSWDGGIATSFAGGDGTEANPYEIATPEQLAFLAALTNGATYHGSKFDTIGKYFKLTADIALNNTSNWETWSTEAPANSWVPINQFNGTFDGDGHVVRGIYINTESSYLGLFGSSYGTIKNVGVVESYIKGDVDTEVYGSKVYVGGVVGVNSGTVINCYFTGTVSGSGEAYELRVGGVLGDNSGTVINCYNTGDVTGETISGLLYIGGVVGRNAGNGTVSNCYNTGDVTGTGRIGYYTFVTVGGVVGWNDYGTVTDCYNTGAVSGTGYYVCVGGVVGANDYGTVSNCYCLDTAYSGDLIGSNSATVTDVEYKTAAQMKSDAFVNLLDIDNETPCWKRSNSVNNGFPILEWQSTCEHNVSKWTIVEPTCTQAGSKSGICTICNEKVTETIAALEHNWSSEWTIDVPATNNTQGSKSHHCTRCDEKTDVTVIAAFSERFSDGNGSESNPYRVGEESVFETIAEMLENNETSFEGLFFELSGNVTIVGSITIGSEDNPFCGTFDGHGHTVTIENGNSGLFGAVGESGKVCNLIVAGAIEASEGNVVGGIANISSGRIINCVFEGQLRGGKNSTYGGICGENSGEILVCLVRGAVESEKTLDCTWGFVVGSNNGKIDYVYYSGKFEDPDDRHGMGEDTAETAYGKGFTYYTKKGKISGSMLLFGEFVWDLLNQGMEKYEISGSEWVENSEQGKADFNPCRLVSTTK